MVLMVASSFNRFLPKPVRWVQVKIGARASGVNPFVLVFQIWASPNSNEFGYPKILVTKHQIDAPAPARTIPLASCPPLSRGEFHALHNKMDSGGECAWPGGFVVRGRRRRRNDGKSLLQALGQVQGGNHGRSHREDEV